MQHFELRVLCEWFLVAPCCSQGATLQVTLWCGPVVCPWQHPPPPPEIWFLGSSGNFKQLLFSEIYFYLFIFFFKIFFHLQKNFPTFNFLCISGCFMPFWVLKTIFTQNFFSPKFLLGEARRDTMLPSISSLKKLEQHVREQDAWRPGYFFFNSINKTSHGWRYLLHSNRLILKPHTIRAKLPKHFVQVVSTESEKKTI